MLEFDRNKILALDKAIAEAERPVIVTHFHPDGDALGSSFGLFRYLKSRGKRPQLVLHDRWPDSLAFIVRDEEKSSIVINLENPELAHRTICEADLVICLDFNTFSRTEGLAGALTESKAFKVLIDHHLYPDEEKFGIVFSRIEISSASELLYYILLEMPDIQGEASLFPDGCGEALMTGMTTDTNNFANSVFPSTFAMASALLATGVDRNGILAHLYNCYRENRVRMMGRLLDKRLKIMENGVAYMIIDRKLGKKFDIKDGETEGFVNIPLGIGRVVISILAKEDEDRFRISIRSKSGYSANKLASRFFNGGGHEQASGGRLIFGTDIANDVAALEKYIVDAAVAFMSEK